MLRRFSRRRQSAVLAEGGASDIVAPSVVITSSSASPNGAAVISCTATFSEAVTGFTVGDITVANGAASNFATVDNIIYTFTVTPTDSAVTIDIAAGVCVDGGGNENTAATQFAITCLTLTLTYTTTSAQTLTFTGLTVAVGQTVTVDWGDGNNNTYTAGAGTRTHAYAGAGTWTVVIQNTQNITRLEIFNDAKFGGTINASNPIPANITYLVLNNAVNIAWVVSSTAPMPTGLTYLYLQNMTNLTWVVSATAPVPSGITSLNLAYMNSLTWTVSATAPIPTGLTTLYIAGVSGFGWQVSETLPVPTGLIYLNLNGLSGLTWTVSATNPMPTGITSLTLYTLANLTWTVSATAPMPTGITSLDLSNLVGITWTVSATAPMPTGITYLFLQTLAGLSGTIGATAPMPTGITSFTILAIGALSIEEAQWARINSIRTIRYESTLSRTAINTILSGIWSNKASFTYATPSIDISGGGNSAASGLYQTGSGGSGLPITGLEYAYDLVNGTYTSAGPEWTVGVMRRNIAIIGDSISLATLWPLNVFGTYMGGFNNMYNRAVSGATVVGAMATQANQTSVGDADVVIFALGTNDDNAGNMTTLQGIVEAGIDTVVGYNPNATLFYMNVLPRWTNSGGGTPVDKSNIRTAIAAGCTAKSIACWDTFTTPWITAAQTSDGLHPTAAGNSAIASEVLALLP